MAREHPGSRGKHFEDVALQFLSRLGYQVAERNWRCPAGELDLVAYQADTLVFIEVRARAAGAPYLPEDTISLTKQRHVAAAAQAYLDTHTRMPSPPDRAGGVHRAPMPLRFPRLLESSRRWIVPPSLPWWSS
jgi:putative endonuclease